MKLIDLIGPLQPATKVQVQIDSNKDKYGFCYNDDDELKAASDLIFFEGVASAVPALLTKLKVTCVDVVPVENPDTTSSAILVISGVFTNEDDAAQYRMSVE